MSGGIGRLEPAVMAGSFLHREKASPEHAAFRETARRILHELALPRLDDWRAGIEDGSEFIGAAGEAGLVGTAAPEALGGGGVDDLRFVATLVEEITAIGATGLAQVVAFHSGILIPLLSEHGTDPQREAWLPEMAEGRTLAAAVAKARSSVDVHYAPSVAGGAIAGLFVVATLDGGTAIVPATAGGISVAALEDGLGGRDSAAADVSFPLASLTAGVLRKGSGGQLHSDIDLWCGVLSVSSARRAFELAKAYVSERRVFGRPLAAFENTRHRLAELGARLDGVQAHVDRALKVRELGPLDPARAAAVRMTAAGLHDQAVDQALQLHGGYGYMEEYPISHAFADAQYLRQQERLWSDPRDVVADALGI